MDKQKLEGENLRSLKDRLKRSIGFTPAQSVPQQPGKAPAASVDIAARIQAERRSALSPLDGRRSKRAQPAHAVQLNVRIDARAKAALLRCAELRGTSMVECIERAIALLERETDKGAKSS